MILGILAYLAMHQNQKTDNGISINTNNNLKMNTYLWKKHSHCHF